MTYLVKQKMSNEKEISRLAAESGRKTTEIEAEVKALIAEGYDELAAMAIWKSSNSLSLGGKFLGDTSLMVIGIDDFQGTRVRDVQTKKGPSKVADIQAFVNDGDDQVLCSITLWGDMAETVEAMEPGSVYDAKIKIIGEDAEGAVKAIILDDSLTEGKADSMPAIGKLLKESQPAALSTIGDYVGTHAFFNGFVGDVFDTGNSIGYSVSDVDSNPIAVYPIHTTDVEKGDSVIVGGKVYAGKKGIGIGSGVIFKA